MPTRNYKLTAVGLSVLLAAVITVLSVLLYTQGPRVRLMAFEEDPHATTLHKNSTTTITFDRPLEDKDYTDQISFTPEVAFSAQTSKQSIIITLEENLRNNTEYNLNLASNIYDQTGRKMKENYQHVFHVGNPRYAYIQRNYGIESTSDSFFAGKDAEDHIKLASLGGEEETIFSAPEISQFATNSNYMAVVVREEEKDRFFSIDLENKEAREEQLPIEGRIDNLAISPRGTAALFSVAPEYSTVSNDYYEEVANRVESLNLETGEVLTLSDEDDEYIRSFSPIQFDPSGQVALIKGDSQTYYAASPFNDYEPILIGSRTASFGFNDSSSEIIFRDSEEFSRYDIKTGDTIPYAFDSRGYIQHISTTGSNVLYSSTTYLFGESKSYIEKINDWENDQVDLIWSNEDHPDSSLHKFSISNDGTILALQINPNQCAYDRIHTNSQCTEAQTVLYSNDTSETLTTLQGFDLVWIP